MQQKENLTAVTDLVKMHMSKQLDDQTTRLLFAASRGDTATISLMCDQVNWSAENIPVRKMYVLGVCHFTF
jgi:hypothetical protein